MTTLEQVEKLRAMSDISYEEAKAALDAAGGNLLDAVIYLEKQGKISPPGGGGYYSSAETRSQNPDAKNPNREYHSDQAAEESRFFTLLKQFGRVCLTLIRKGNRNTFEVSKDNEPKLYFPVTVLALLLIFAFWFTVPLALIGLFFGYRYRFSGPDFQKQTINTAMDDAAKAAEDLKKSML